MTFKSLARGDKFIFEGEVKFPYSGIAKGPWVKTGTRTYSHVPDDGYGYRVGSINVKVIPQGQSLRLSNPKRRRNMDQSAARELELFIENDGDLYRQQYTPILKNLALKKAKGIYDHAKAVKLFRYMVDRADKIYFSQADPWRRQSGKVLTDTATRNHVADSLARKFEREYDLGNYGSLLPKKYQKNPRVAIPKDWTNAQVRINERGQVQVKIRPRSFASGRSAVRRLRRSAGRRSVRRRY